MLGHFGTENYASEINSFCLIFWVQNVLISQDHNMSQRAKCCNISKLYTTYQDEFENAEFNGGVHFFCFQLEIPFSGKCGPKNKKCSWKMKSDNKTHMNMQNSLVVFTYFVFKQKYTFCRIWP